MTDDSGVEPDPLTPMSDDEPTSPGAVELPSQAPRAGDLGDLTVERLAAERQWTALAALAHHTSGEGWGLQALRQLIQHADYPDAFSWLWALLPDQTPRAWAGLTHLPHPLTIPAHLITNVTSKIMLAATNGGSNSRSLVHLLRVLEPANKGTVQVAEALLTPGENPPEEFLVEALRLLGANHDPNVRDDLLADADAAAKGEPANVQRQIRMVAALQSPLREVEVLASEKAVDALTTSTPMSPAWAAQYAPWAWPALQVLTPRLSPEHLVQLCTQPWITGDGGADIAAALFTNGLSTQAVTALLGGATSFAPGVRDALLQHVASRPDDEGIRLIEDAHRVVPIAYLSPMHASLVQQVEEATHLNLLARLRALRRLQAAALAMPRARPLHVTDDAPSAPPAAAALGSDPALLAWVRALRPGEISEVVCSELAPEQLRHLGAALGLLLLQAHEPMASRNYTTAHAESDAIHMLRHLDDAGCAAVLSGLTTVAAGIVPEAVHPLALRTGPQATAVMGAAEPASTAAHLCDALTADPVALPVERVLNVLEAVPAHTSIAAAQALLHVVDWKALEQTGSLPRAGTALARHPRLLHEALTKALSSQSGPGSRRASTARLIALIQAHFEVPAAHQLQEPAAAIQQLAQMDDAALKDLAATWMTRAPISDALLDVVITADRSAARPPSRYAGARHQIAEAEAAVARDPDRYDHERTTALQRASRADENLARATALEVMAAAGLELRRAAAEVLATTTGASADTPLVEDLLEQEEDATVADLLTRARRRLASGSLGEALANLVELVGAASALADLDTTICLPYQRWHETFTARVDQARTATLESTESRMTSLVLLADLLADQAITATYLASGRADEQIKGQALLENSPSRPKAGALAKDGRLGQELTWLPQWAALRADRIAHPAPLGDTTHRGLNDNEVDAAVITLRRITEGWLRAMYTAHGTPFPATLG